MPATHSKRSKIAIRRQIILDTLRAHPWSSSSQVSEIVLEETGGTPTLATGVLWIAPWTIFNDLVVLEVQGKVERRTITTRRIWWRALDPEPQTVEGKKADE